MNRIVVLEEDGYYTFRLFSYEMGEMQPLDKTLHCKATDETQLMLSLLPLYVSNLDSDLQTEIEIYLVHVGNKEVCSQEQTFFIPYKAVVRYFTLDTLASVLGDAPLLLETRRKLYLFDNRKSTCTTIEKRPLYSTSLTMLFNKCNEQLMMLSHEEMSNNLKGYVEERLYNLLSSATQPICVIRQPLTTATPDYVATECKFFCINFDTVESEFCQYICAEMATHIGEVESSTIAMCYSYVMNQCIKELKKI